MSEVRLFEDMEDREARGGGDEGGRRGRPLLRRRTGLMDASLSELRLCVRYCVCELGVNLGTLFVGCTCRPRDLG